MIGPKYLHRNLFYLREFVIHQLLVTKVHSKMHIVGPIKAKLVHVIFVLRRFMYQQLAVNENYEFTNQSGWICATCD